MLEVARGRAPNAAELHQGDFRTFDLGRRFDAIVCLFSSIGYLVDEPDLRSAISNFSRHLEPGGVLLVEGWVEPEFWLESTVATEAARADGLAVARAVHTRREGSICELSMRYLVAMPGSGLRTIDEHHRMRLSDPGEVEAAYLASGLTFERLPHMLHAGRSVFLGVRGDV